MGRGLGLPTVTVTCVPEGGTPARGLVGGRTRVAVQDTADAPPAGGVVPETHVLRTPGVVQGVHVTPPLHPRSSLVRKSQVLTSQVPSLVPWGPGKSFVE